MTWFHDLGDVSFVCEALVNKSLRCLRVFDNRYEGESPDEVALVHAAAAHGCKLTARNSEYVTVALPGTMLSCH